MSNVQRLTGFIGKTGLLTISGHAGIQFKVKILDVKMLYGSLTLLCEPMAGQGAKWYGIGGIQFDGGISYDRNGEVI